MKIQVFITIFLFICCLACKSDREKNVQDQKKKPDSEMAFDAAKWKMKIGSDYPYREKMLNDVVYNDTIRALNKDGILALLGEPDRSNNGHLYYRIAEERMGFWTLHAQTLVIKLSEDNSIDWIRIHE